MALSKFKKPELSYEEQRKLCVDAMPSLKTNPTYLFDLPDVSKRMTHQEKVNYLVNFNNTPNCIEFTIKYTVIKKIGSGTFGDVFMAHEIANPSKLVAAKKIKIASGKHEGFPMTALREINILKQLQHDNIVKLIEVCRTTVFNEKILKFSYSLVLEYCEHDLGGILLNQMIDISDSEKKNLLKQLFIGVAFIHQQNVLHRDIKSANLLLNKNGYLKLADMGLARNITKPGDDTQNKVFTNCVVTLWYRAPELLLGAIVYGYSVDIWSVALIMCEMWHREPFLQGNTEAEQLSLIVRLCGSITIQSCPSAPTYPLFRKLKLPSSLPRNVFAKLKDIMLDPLCLDLTDRLLQLEPSRRMSASDALTHKYFHSSPFPTDLRPLMKRIKGNYYTR